VTDIRTGLVSAVAMVFLLTAIWPPALSAAGQEAGYARWLEHSRKLRSDPRLAAYFDFEAEDGVTLTNKAAGGPDDPGDGADKLEMTIYGAAWTTTEGRWKGKGGLRFHGSGDFVERAGVTGMPSGGQITLEAWFISYVDGVEQSIVSCGDLKDYFFWLVRRTRDDRIGLWMGHAGNTRNAASWTSDRAVSKGVWHHVVATYNKDAEGLVAVYLDGSLLAGSVDGSGGEIASPTSYFEIGCDDDVHGNTFNGIIDEVAIYKRALTADEIGNHYEMGKPAVVRRAIPKMKERPFSQKELLEPHVMQTPGLVQQEPDAPHEMETSAFSQKGVRKPEWGKYPVMSWGFAGMDLQQVIRFRSRPAVRTMVGPRSLGLSKGGICRLANGDLLVAGIYAGESPKNVMKIARSRDGAHTWEMVETKGARLLGKEPGLQVLSDGVLLLLTSHPHGFRVHRSQDSGVTWTVTPIGRTYDDEELHFDPGYGTVRNVLEEPDGSLMMIMSMNGPESGAEWSRTWRFWSHDRGITWQKREEAKIWKFELMMFGEASFARLADGRILAVSRTHLEPPIKGPPPAGPTPPHLPINEADNFLMLTESADNGLTWSTPRAISNYAEVHGHLLVLADGRILCTYASYHYPYGVLAMLSEDNGKTWDRKRPIRLAYSLSVYCGWPSSIQLPDGDIVTYYVGSRYREKSANVFVPGAGDGFSETVRWKLPARRGR